MFPTQSNPSYGLTSSVRIPQLVIKVRLGGDIRRLPIQNEELTYDDLILMLCRVFQGKISVEDNILLRYEDEDGDLITIADNADLQHAKQTSRVLKIRISVKGKTFVDEEEVPSMSDLRQEMKLLVEGLSALCSKLDRLSAQSSSSSSAPQKITNGPPSSVTPTSKPPTSTLDPKKDEAKPSAPKINDGAKLFDPLQQNATTSVGPSPAPTSTPMPTVSHPPSVPYAAPTSQPTTTPSYGSGSQTQQPYTQYNYTSPQLQQPQQQQQQYQQPVSNNGTQYYYSAPQQLTPPPPPQGSSYPQQYQSGNPSYSSASSYSAPYPTQPQTSNYYGNA